MEEGYSEREREKGKFIGWLFVGGIYMLLVLVRLVGYLWRYISVEIGEKRKKIYLCDFCSRDWDGIW